ncbi:MAG TPA: TetR/AcrR family transcriptional regulator [Candidatus Angelobacter sp.]|nr:TetR/AcrR family transcriptional regulator [Candidatus Angelobacter sp.]
MARPKEFDTQAVLDQAMDLFWSKGFEATSMSDLVEHLGLARQSVYDTFGDKRAVYTAALRSYCQQRVANARALFRSDSPVRAVLHEYLSHTIDKALGEEDPRGCMLINAAVELASADEATRELVTNTLKAIGRELTIRLRRAQENGEIGKHQDPVALARFFGSVMAGLLVLVKTTRERRALEDVVDVALKTLG